MLFIVDPAQHGLGLPVLAHGGECQDELGCLGDGHPRVVGHAPGAESFYYELVPEPLYPLFRLGSRDGAAENRIEPVHGIARLGLVEEVGAVLEGVPEPLEGQLLPRLALA